MDRKLLILDIDETLLYSSEKQLSYEHDFVLDRYLVYKRPGVDNFLQFCFKLFDVAIWTSSSEDYADGIVSNLIENPDELAFLWARKRCVTKFNSEYYTYEYIKDLKKVKRKGFDLDKVIMVDNTPEKLRRNYGNLVSVSSYEGETEDEELVALQEYLKKLVKLANIRSIEKRGWRNAS